jgi:LAO/AO transport system kinase
VPLLELKNIVEGIERSDTRSVARAISIVETPSMHLERNLIIKGIYHKTGNAGIIGITGPPGIGKSTMIGNLCKMLSSENFRVSVLAVDASSPFSGGSLLGNRIRMQENLSRYGVFMRSLANRGLNGGLSRAVWDAVDILDAAGNDFIIVETVGAGQADLDIVNLADTVIVVLGPGLGDQIQAIKAGIMEIGHIFVVNKIDRDGSFIAIKDLEETLAFTTQGEWKIPVYGTNSLTTEGYGDLINGIKNHTVLARSSPEFRRKRYKEEMRIVMQDEVSRIINRKFNEMLLNNNEIDSLLETKTDPYSAARKILNGNSVKL